MPTLVTPTLDFREDLEPTRSGAEASADTTDQSTETAWSTFIVPASLPLSHPYLSRYCTSALLSPNTALSSQANTINTTHTAHYGNPSSPIALTIGNGGAGYTGIFKPLCAQFIWRYGKDFRIAWVANPSRMTVCALLGGVVDVALNYEKEADKFMEREGWGRLVSPGGGSGPVFYDHFILAGPKSDPAGIGGKGLDVRETLRRIAQGGEGVKFFSRGDGSATFVREQQFWNDIGIDPNNVDCIEKHPLSPPRALVKAEEGGTYLLTDRSSYLTAKRDGLITDMRVYVEGGTDLLNPCSVSVNMKVPESVSQRLAVRFAEWLHEKAAQDIFRGYGRVWELGLPLFTGRDREEVADEEGLVGRDW